MWNPGYTEINGSLDIGFDKVRISPRVFVFFKHLQPVTPANLSLSQVQHLHLRHRCCSSMSSLQITELGAQKRTCYFRCRLSSNLIEILFFCYWLHYQFFFTFLCFTTVSCCIFMSLIKTWQKKSRPYSDLPMESTALPTTYSVGCLFAFSSI